MLSKINEGLLAPNTLVNALESVLVIFAGRSLSIESSEISTLTGKINKEKQYIAEFQDGIAILSRDGVTDAIRKMLTNIEKHAQEIGIEFVQSPAADTQKESIEVLLQNCIQKAEEKIDQHNKQIGIVLRHGMLLGLLLSLPITGLYYFANHHVLQLVGQHPFVVEKSKEYFQAAALGFVPLTLLTAQQRLLQGLHQPFPVLISNTLHTALCAAFSYLFTRLL